MLSGLLVPYLIGHFYGGRHEGHRPHRSVTFSCGNYYIHFHHWIMAVVAFSIIIFFTRHPFILGILIGSIVHGLTFKDRFVIFYRKKDYDPIYQKWK